jgi:hypothetical protein
MLSDRVAVMAHTPVAVALTRFPETVQFPSPAYDTGSPDEVLAVSAKGAEPAALAGIGPNLMLSGFRIIAAPGGVLCGIHAETAGAFEGSPE